MVLERVLVADDDPHIRRLLEYTLKSRGYEVLTASDGELALEAYRQAPPDIVLLDVMMPKLDGYAVCKRIRELTRSRRIPVLMLTAMSDASNKITGFDNGADDYVTKPFNIEELVARIKAHLRRAKEEYSANPLTGLPGNTMINNTIATRLASGIPWSVMYADLDHFKSYNDVYGFAAGDKVIQFVATLISQITSELGNQDDFVGHIGGDDFVVVTTPDRMDAIATQIISRLSSSIGRFYSPEDLRAGMIITEDRRGNIREFPIMKISIGAVTSATGPFHSYLEVTEVATEMKRFAKQQEQKFAVSRRRRGPRHSSPAFEEDEIQG